MRRTTRIAYRGGKWISGSTSGSESGSAMHNPGILRHFESCLEPARPVPATTDLRDRPEDTSATPIALHADRD